MKIKTAKKVSLDGVATVHMVRRFRLHTVATKNVDGVRLVPRLLVRRHSVSPPSQVFFRQSRSSWPVLESLKQFFRRPYGVALFAVLLLMAVTFGAGMVAALNTSKTAADDSGQVLGAFTDESSSVGASVPLGTVDMNATATAVSNEVLFNTPINLLQQYFTSLNPPDVVGQRADKLRQFLKDANSPFAGSAETIAAQEHWKLILAIAFAESTLGKNCVDYNCSNIGIKPGAPVWHQYKSYDSWVVDFNRLLDRRYKDWTLDQMCGVYVKPCSNNWLLATKQVLDELDKRGIN